MTRFALHRGSRHTRTAPSEGPDGNSKLPLWNAHGARNRNLAAMWVHFGHACHVGPEIYFFYTHRPKLRMVHVGGAQVLHNVCSSDRGACLSTELTTEDNADIVKTCASSAQLRTEAGSTPGSCVSMLWLTLVCMCVHIIHGWGHVTAHSKTHPRLGRRPVAHRSGFQCYQFTGRLQVQLQLRCSGVAGQLILHLW